MSTKGRLQGLLLGSLCLLALISVFAFSKNSGYLFPGGDGLLVLMKVRDLGSLSPTGIGSSATMLQGLGGMSAVSYAFEPSYNLGLLFFGPGRVYTEEFQIFVLTLLSLEIFLATFVAAQSFGLGRLVSLMAAWMAPLLILPYFGFSLFYPLLVFAPHAGTIISENLLILAAFTYVGRPLKRGTIHLWKDGMLWAAITLMLVHMTISEPLVAILWLPVQIVLGAGLLLSAGSRGEILSKIMWAAAALLTWFGVFSVYLYGQFAYTATRFWPAELENSLAQWQFVSSWFRPLESAGKLVISAALVGLLLALINRPLRGLAIAMLVLMLLVFGGGALIVRFDFWRGPAPVYFEMFITPIYAMFAAYAVVRGGAILRDAVVRYRPHAAPGLQRLQTIGSAIAIGIIPAAAIAGSLDVNTVPRIYGPAPPTLTPLVSTLADKVAISPGAAFRGRVATLLLQNRSEPAGWPDMIRVNAPRAEQPGNDYYWSGLWPFHIPTLFEYNQLMSPAFYRTAVDLWARPEDKQVRNAIVLRRVEPKTLALFGVRFVISDAALPAPFRLEATERTTGETLYLYEVPNVNLGGYSPTEVTKVATFKEALDAVSAFGFDAQRTAVVFDVDDGLKQKLVPAKDVQIRIEKGAFVVSASSSGPSLLILPFEFSHCLEVSSASADAPAPVIFRADGPLIGMLFSNRLNARIEYRTSPFAQPTCRIQDALAFSRLVRD